MRYVTGEQLAQVDNPDPFASPVWRSPVRRTPEGLIMLVQFLRSIWLIVRFAVRHPLLSATIGLAVWLWLNAGWQAVAALAGAAAAGLLTLRLARPDWFTRFVSLPVRCRWRWWFYRRRWQAVMTVTRLAPTYRGRVVVPVLGRVEVTGCTDRVRVTLVSGQAPADFAARADGIAHGFRAYLCRVRAAGPGAVVLELVRRDALAEPMPALPISEMPDLDCLPIGRCEDGTLFALRLRGTHLLIAGATGAGKGSYLWCMIRAMLALMVAGLVRVWACDPKLMELAFGRALFDRYGRYAAEPAGIADLLEDAVADMQKRARLFAGHQRDHTPTAEHPFVVIVVDEIAFLTAYQADRKLRERTLAALATLTTQGRAVGYSVVAALQDPRKEVLNIRNLFPDKIALRLDEPGQADMVLGDGARDRGAACDQISSNPLIGAGVGFVRLEADPDPIRVRAAFVSDDDIRAMVTAYATSASRHDHRLAVRRGLPRLRRPAAGHQHRPGVPHPGVPRLRLPHQLAPHQPRPAGHR